MLPLDTFEDLLSWERPRDDSERCTIDFSERKLQKECGLPISETDILRRNKVLFCHDMMGGYLDDATIQDNENVYAYRFYHWHLIDVFVYFSHHFITIPPTGWIYQAHKNGVQCLGTLIIERGDHIDNFIKLFHGNNMEAVIEKLNDIRKFYNFDGWLVTIQCAISGDKVQHIVKNICQFLLCLSNSENEVIWYDAITVSGQLKWQNCLNKENRIFYDHCGKIFTNYCWNKNSLINSLIESKGYGDTVFVGVDCYGRGCPGGGGFNCNYALKMIEDVSNQKDLNHNSKLSIALFAPGWCYESVPSDLREKEVDDSIWCFFNHMADYLQSHLGETKIYRQLPEICIHRREAFSTNFDIGQGYLLNINGISIEGRAHNNLMDQEIIPSGCYIPREGVVIKFLPCREFGFSGYGCFKMVVNIEQEYNRLALPIVIELFRFGCHIDKDIDATLHIFLGEEKDLVKEDIWSNLYLKLSFSVANSRMQCLEYKLEDMLKTDSRTETPYLKWNHFQIDNLCARLKEEVEVVLRKLEVVVKDEGVIYNLTKSSLHFGQVIVESMK